MKIVIIGGSGLIGTKVATLLTERGHAIVPASRKTGIDAVTGSGLAGALAGADVVVDVTNPPPSAYEDGTAVLTFFETAGRNLARAGREAGVRHHVVLSVVGTDRLQASGYFRAKLAQERLVEGSGVPYTILRATQFFEFLGGIAAGGTEGNRVRLSTASFQPVAADDVAGAVADVAVAKPLGAIIDLAGPERKPMHEILGRYLAQTKDPREVVGDPAARYFGTPIDDTSLVPLGEARLGATHLDDWLRQSAR